MRGNFLKEVKVRSNFREKKEYESMTKHFRKNFSFLLQKRNEMIIIIIGISTRLT